MAIVLNNKSGDQCFNPCDTSRVAGNSKMSHKYPEAYDSTLELVGVCFKRATQDYAENECKVLNVGTRIKGVPYPSGHPRLIIRIHYLHSALKKENETMKGKIETLQRDRETALIRNEQLMKENALLLKENASLEKDKARWSPVIT